MSMYPPNSGQWGQYAQQGQPQPQPPQQPQNGQWGQYAQQPQPAAPPPVAPVYYPTAPIIDANRFADLEARYAQMVSLLQTKAQFPTQQRAGVIRYPNRIPFPMTLAAELKPTSNPSNGFYGTTNEVVRASINIDVENPTFLEHVSFNLYRPNTENNALNAPPESVGIFLPLSAFRQPFITVVGGGGSVDTYIGRDFRWRVVNASNSRLWQDGMKTSDQANADDRRGYKLPVEYEVSRNDVLVFEAQPIGVPYVAGAEQDFVLEVVLHIYKMVMPG